MASIELLDEIHSALYWQTKLRLPKSPTYDTTPRGSKLDINAEDLEIVDTKSQMICLHLLPLLFIFMSVVYISLNPFELDIALERT